MRQFLRCRIEESVGYSKSKQLRQAPLKAVGRLVVSVASCGGPEVRAHMQADVQGADTALPFGLQTERLHDIEIFGTLQAIPELHHIGIVPADCRIGLQLTSIAARTFGLAEAQR